MAKKDGGKVKYKNADFRLPKRKKTSETKTNLLKKMKIKIRKQKKKKAVFSMIFFLRNKKTPKSLIQI